MKTIQDKMALLRDRATQFARAIVATHMATNPHPLKGNPDGKAEAIKTIESALEQWNELSAIAPKTLNEVKDDLNESNVKPIR